MERVFQFGTQCVPEAPTVAVVPRGVGTKAELFNSLSVGLSLPGYFGRNWDALEECLGNLEWLPAGDVILYHEDLPALDFSSLRIYLSILEAAVRSWQRKGERAFVVAFPKSDEGTVLALLDQRI